MMVQIYVITNWESLKGSSLMPTHSWAKTRPTTMKRTADRKIPRLSELNVVAYMRIRTVPTIVIVPKKPSL